MQEQKKEQQRFSLSRRLESFKYAFQGLYTLFREEHNAWIHLFAAVCAVAAGALFRISVYEWIAVIFAIGIVFAAESLNSAIEHLADHISPEKNEMIGKIKDLAAAGVLVAALTALVIGLIIFLPRIVEMFQG